MAMRLPAGFGLSWLSRSRSRDQLGVGEAAPFCRCSCSRLDCCCLGSVKKAVVTRKVAMSGVGSWCCSVSAAEPFELKEPCWEEIRAKELSGCCRPS